MVVHPDAQRAGGRGGGTPGDRPRGRTERPGGADLVLTGGTVASRCWPPCGAPAPARVDWALVDFWWGDERFEPSGDPLRVDAQAREALLDHVPLDPARVHAMPPSDGPDGDDPEAAAARYADELARMRRTVSRYPRSTCCCSASAPMPTSRRSSRSTRRCRRRSARWSPSQLAEASADQAQPHHPRD